MAQHKPGWKGEPYRHQLAAKGVRTVTPEQRQTLDTMFEKHQYGKELVEEGLSFASTAIDELGAKERILNPQPYESINDVWPEGDYEVFYSKNSEAYHRLLQRASEELEVKKDDFVSLGSIQADGKESVYAKMQGEMWSPFGQANNIIRNSGAGHTSMSVGDIIKHGEEYYLVAPEGFVKAKVV